MERAAKCQQAPQHFLVALKPDQDLPFTKCQSKTFINQFLQAHRALL